MDEESINLARGFIDMRAGGFHSAFAEESYFNPEKSQYQPKDSSMAESTDLGETLSRYQAAAKSQHFEFELDFDPLRCTWDDVLRELERAKAATSESEDRGKRLHKRAWRAMGTTGADIFLPALAAIPDKLCVLQGGLAVMFTACQIARQRAQSRLKILRAFGDIPNLIMMATDKAENLPKNHPRSDQLRNIIEEFQKTLLRTLPALISRLNPGTIVGRALSPFKTVDIDNLLDAVRYAADKVRVSAEGMMDSLMVTTNRTVSDNFKTTQNIHTITQHTEGEVGELRGKIEKILEQQKHLQVSLDSISGKNNLLSFLVEYLKPLQCEDRILPKEPPPVHESATPITARELLQLMNIHHLDAIDTEGYIIRRGHSMGHDAISHAASMFQTLPVRKLLHSTESGVVLVNGCLDRSQLAKISPVTYICATLTQALRRSPECNMVLAFFCGQHSTSKDDLMGPQGLMRSFVAYLVLALVQNDSISESEQIWFPDVARNFEQHSFENICQLFYRLVELVPKGITLHCLVDGISYYEQASRREDYDLMMACFHKIISNEQKSATFKLLLTSPTTSRWLSSMLQSHQQISLRNLRGKSTANPDTYLRGAFGDTPMYD